ncbi:MAG: class II fructose-bisphosphate aldolase [Erysipelotrichaceae bacterium]|nr:class II fructose-bisphosphate aldolase [Erysipelotrichaceae bacterium]
MKDLLNHAHKNNYAVIAANCVNYELAKAIIETADEFDSPIIVNIAQGQIRNHADPEVVGMMVRAFAARTRVPVALNLDHGEDMEYVFRAYRAGFSGLMIDASSKSFEDNVAITKKVVELARVSNIGVEAELGHVGQAVNGDGQDEDFYTNVEDAVRFVKDTGVDALAVAVGTAHGAYPKGRIPKIDFERLTKLKKALDMPLVLHGGSGSGDENIKKAVSCGINKINVWTDISIACDNAAKNKLETQESSNFMRVMMDVEQAIKKVLGHYFEIAGSKGMGSKF